MLYFINKMLCEDPVENITIGGKKRGYRFNVRLNNYRGTFLSTVEGVEVKVDGKEVPTEDLTFCLNQKRYTIPELVDQYKEYWYVLDKASIEVACPGGLSEGDHVFEVAMSVRSLTSGYTGSTEFPVMKTAETKTLQVIA